MTAALIRDYYAAFNRGDVDGMLDCLSDDIRHDVNQGDARHGKAAFAAFCAHMARTYREQLTDMIIMATADGTRAAAEFVVNGEYVPAVKTFHPPLQSHLHVFALMDQ